MSLPVPTLDDRTFQDLVDDAKRLVQYRCPEWTDHNVSDPGVTLIETFAWMTELLIHRLNGVPDRLYVKFLEMIGVRLMPPVAARADITFWLSAPQPEIVSVPAGTRVATARSETQPAITFSTVEDLAIVPTAVAQIGTEAAAGDVRLSGDPRRIGEPLRCFSQVPAVGDALLIGLTNPAPSCAVLLRFDCETAEGEGVRPDDPPLAWEAFDGERWASCEIDGDGTGGLNKPGDVIVHVPRAHVAASYGGAQAGWLRCRVLDSRPGQGAYRESPSIRAVKALTRGGTALAVHADVVRDETLGMSDGRPAQRFGLAARPVVPSEEPIVIDVVTPEGSEEWARVESFADSGPEDRHFVVDDVEGEVVFGPLVREADGTARLYGGAPPAGGLLKVRSYRTGGGASGNVAAGAIKMLKSSIPYVTQVTNRRPAIGGVDGEDLEGAKARGPMALRGTRAVAERDYEYQAMKAAPNQVARVRCVSAGDGADAGGVRVLVVPNAEDDDAAGRIRFERLTPLDPGFAGGIAAYLERRRCVGARVSVEPPLYMGISIVARVRASSRTTPKRLEQDALAVLYRHFHPLRGGTSKRGWPFGRPIHVGEAYAVLQRVPGIAFVEEVRLYPTNPFTMQRGEATERLELEPTALVFSCEHTVEAIAEDEP